MGVGQLRSLAASGGALDEALLDKERLVHILYRACLLAYGRGDGVQADRPALEFLDYRLQDLVVHLIQTARVDVQSLQGYARDLQVDMALALDHRKVPHSTQQGVGDTGRATRTQCHLVGGIVVDRDVDDSGRALDDTRQNGRVVVLQVAGDTKSGAEGRGQKTTSCGGTDQRERRQIQFDRVVPDEFSGEPPGSKHQHLQSSGGDSDLFFMPVGPEERGLHCQGECAGGRRDLNTARRHLPFEVPGQDDPVQTAFQHAVCRCGKRKDKTGERF